MSLVNLTDEGVAARDGPDESSVNLLMKASHGWHDRPEQRISDVLRLDEAIAGLQLGLDHALPFPRNPPPKK